MTNKNNKNKFDSITSNKSNLFYFILFSLFLITLNSNSIFSSSNVLDIQMSESVFENNSYSPLANKTLNNFQITGLITITNTHTSEAIENIQLNFSNLNKIYNLTFNSGTFGYISKFNISQNKLQLVIPDLGPLQNSTFTYSINLTNNQSPLKFDTSYSSFNVFTGNSFQITDTLVNNLNSSQFSNNCIYNISVTQNSLQVPQIIPVNFEIQNPITGSDSTNASINGANRTLTWDVLNGGCINSAQTQNITYTLQSPNNIEVSDDYQIISSLYNYQFNDTISQLNLDYIYAQGDLELDFQKYRETILPGDNATWKITSNVESSSDLLVNLDKVTLWVSQRNGTGTGFTNPALLDNDTISNEVLEKTYFPNQNLNSSLPAWNNIAAEWFFNYTYSSSPIVWMDLENILVNDGIQLSNRSLTYAENQVFIKEIYVAAGYWLEIKKDITKISDDNFNIFIKVSNLGSAVTPASQAVVVYNFIPNTFTLTSPFQFSQSTWYSTQATNATLNDPIYNGTMHQYALLQNSNPYNSSLDRFGGSENSNNTWTLTYNVTGVGEFKFDDLFLTGVDPLNVGEIGGTKGITMKSEYKSSTSFSSYILPTLATIFGLLVILL
jgi:hypothetical protein